MFPTTSGSIVIARPLLPLMRCVQMAIGSVVCDVWRLFWQTPQRIPPLPVRLTLVSKNGPPTQTPTCSVSRGRLRRRNRTKGNLPLALQFVRGPGGGSPAVGERGIQYEWKFLLESHF